MAPSSHPFAPCSATLQNTAPAARPSGPWRLLCPALLTLSLVTLPSLAQGQPPASNGPPPDLAAAEAALAAGDLEAARRAYEQAFAQERSFDRAGNLGAVELKLGHHDQAVEHLSFALEHFPPDGSPELRTALEHRLAEAHERGGTLATPGRRPGAGAPATPEASASDPGPSPVLITIGASLAVAAAAAGAAFAAVSAARDDLAFTKGGALEQLALPDPCGSYPNVCDEIRAEQDARDSYGAAAGIAFGVAGAAAIGTLLYALLATDDEPPDSTEAAFVRPALSPDAAGLTLRVSW